MEEFQALQAQIEQLIWYDWGNFLNETLPGFKPSYFALDVQGVDQVSILPIDFSVFILYVFFN